MCHQPSHGLTQRLIGIVTLGQKHRQRDERWILALAKLDLLLLQKAVDQLRGQQLGKWQTRGLGELALEQVELAGNRSSVSMRHCRPPCLNGFFEAPHSYMRGLFPY